MRCKIKREETNICYDAVNIGFDNSAVTTLKIIWMEHNFDSEILLKMISISTNIRPVPVKH